jgi:hypothetical protein
MGNQAATCISSYRNKKQAHDIMILFYSRKFIYLTFCQTAFRRPCLAPCLSFCPSGPSSVCKAMPYAIILCPVGACRSCLGASSQPFKCAALVNYLLPPIGMPILGIMPFIFPIWPIIWRIWSNCFMHVCRAMPYAIIFCPVGAYRSCPRAFSQPFKCAAS